MKEKEFNNIPDFSKIMARELPTFDIIASFDGEEKTYKAQVLDDGAFTTFIQSFLDRDDVMRQRSARLIVLSNGMIGWTQNIASMAYANNPAECMRVADIIFEKTDEFFKNKKKESDIAQKNSEGEVIP